MHMVSLMDERFAKEHAVYPKGQYALCERTKLAILFSGGLDLMFMGMNLIIFILAKLIFRPVLWLA